jgi:hypothetical protein
MAEFTMQLNSPITDEQWNAITDAELEHSKGIEFTTPRGKKVLFQKVQHGKWISGSGVDSVRCGCCHKNYDWSSQAQYYNFCPNCGADMRDKVV